jgi:hypothetical protein
MVRSFAGILVFSLVLAPAVPAVASEKPDTVRLVAPTKAVAEAWAKEERARSTSKTLTALQVTYSGLQGMDLWTTMAARRNGAREMNPLMEGSYAKGAALKAAMGAGTIMATRAMAKKSKKAAVVTMFVLNGVTAAVVANNIRNARR